jgi:hypothetical protein
VFEFGSVFSWLLLSALAEGEEDDAAEDEEKLVGVEAGILFEVGGIDEDEYWEELLLDEYEDEDVGMADAEADEGVAKLVEVDDIDAADKEEKGEGKGEDEGCAAFTTGEEEEDEEEECSIKTWEEDDDDEDEELEDAPEVEVDGEVAVIVAALAGCDAAAAFGGGGSIGAAADTVGRNELLVSLRDVNGCEFDFDGIE